MRIADLRPAANISIHHALSVQPQSAALKNHASSGLLSPVPPQSDVNIVSLEDSKNAKAMVKQGDSDIAIQYALAQVDKEIAGDTSGQINQISTSLSNIPHASSFGTAWSAFNLALTAEPFATFAKNNKIDTSMFDWYPPASMRCLVDGKTTFADTLPGWEEAAANLITTAKWLSPDGDTFPFYGENKVPLELLGNFYGHDQGSRGPRKLPLIGEILTTRSFPAHSDSKNRQHQNVIERQQQATETIGAELSGKILPPMLPAQTVATQVIEADKEVAQMSATALLLRRNEIRPADASLTSGYVITPPERSTIGQTIKAFNTALQAEEFLDFARKKNVDISTVNISQPAGDLMVLDLPNRVFRTIATVNDQSGWAQVSSEIRALANQLGKGTKELVSYNPDGSISVIKALSFYGEHLPADTLKDALTRSTALYHKGFPALNRDTPPADESTRAVQQAQLAAIQQLENASTVQPVTSVLDKTPVNTIDPATSIANSLFSAAPSVYSAVASWLGFYVQRTAHGAGDLDINHLSIGILNPENPGERKDIPLMQYAMDALSNSKSLSIPAGAKLFDTRPDLLARTGTPGYVPVPIDMNALKNELLRLPTQLETIYKTATHGYWRQPAFTAPAVYSGSRQSLVSRLLQDNLQRAGLKQPGLDAEQRKTVDMVVKHPEGSTRAAPQDPSSSPATVYRLTNGPENEDTPNLLIHRALAGPNREILLLVEPSGKITPYDSWDAFDQAGHVKSELTGNPFDTQASIIIDGELGDTLSVNPSAADAPSQTQAAAQPPAWVNQANDSQRVALHHLMLELAGFVQRNKGQSYDYAIDDLRTFAQKQFDAQLPSPRSYNTSQIEIEFKPTDGSLFAGWGGGISAGVGTVERVRMSMTDMLLRNLSGLPDGQIDVYYKSDGKPGTVRITALEGEGVLKKKVQDADIGKKYPEFLKQELLDDPTKKAQRLSLFAQQVPIELKLQALKLATTGAFGFDTTGFRYVEQILDPTPGTKTVDGKEIVIRPLAFTREPGTTPDVVSNMYLIEPKDSTTGPHILYRPLNTTAQLLQFPTRQALMEAIQKPNQLQKDILAWLPDDATRKIYNNSGFKEPHIRRFTMGDDFAPLSTPAPPVLTTEGHAATQLQQALNSGQLINRLYEDNANGLASLADQQSVSNAENRWASAKRGGLLVLNSVLPVLRGPLAYIGIAMQALGIGQDINALASKDGKNKETALADLLLNLATLFLHFRTPSPGNASETNASQEVTSGRLLPPETSSPTQPTYPIQLGGPVTKVDAIEGEIQTFVDTYDGAERINIFGHGEEPKPGQPTKIVGENGALYSAQEIYDKLLARGIDLKKYRNIRTLFCYSADGGTRSFASDLHTITGKPVKGFEGTVIASYSDNKFPDEIYEDFYASYKAADQKNLPINAIKQLANNDLYEYYATQDIFPVVIKEHGDPIRVNYGTAAKPVWVDMPINYRPVRVGPPKGSEPVRPSVVPPKVEVLMGNSRTIEDNNSVLSTESLTDCSALVVLTDLKDGVYQKRTLMHLTGSSLEFGLPNEDTAQLMDDLDQSLASGGKVIFVGGVNSSSRFGMGMVVGQEYNGKKPLLDILQKPGVETVFAGSSGVEVKPNGTFTLAKAGPGLFDSTLSKQVLDFAA
ncbi:hypothetical protein JFU58_19410 [Pseudomonas sp. TH34]|uniref:hypothetical protein n=1 Tax=Pseudomonas sp. TH34 TaxID=2796399 RepID=UPI001913B4B1|nr:hypothetical protein [Pseudomonas sp. TH34]MBK5410704.1 hypothetical protein [Pseudomonas sp. TH34]